jgi:hypothetical protein
MSHPGTKLCDEGATRSFENGLTPPNAESRPPKISAKRWYGKGITARESNAFKLTLNNPAWWIWRGQFMPEFVL